MANQIRKPILQDYVYLIALACLWSSSFMFIKIAVTHINPVSMTTMRLFFAAIAMAIIVIVLHKKHPFCKKTILPLLPFIALSAFFGNALPFTLIAYGETHIDSSVAALLMGVMPLVTLLLAHFTTQDDKLNIYKMLGVILGIIGIIILIGYDAILQGKNTWFYQLAIALGACSYAVNSLIMRHISADSKLLSSMLIMVASAMFMLPIDYLYTNLHIMQFFTAPFSAIISTIILGVFHAGIASVIMFRVLDINGASFFSQINFIIPILGFFWGVAFLSEPISLNVILALCCISFGILIARKGQG